MRTCKKCGSPKIGYHNKSGLCLLCAKSLTYRYDGAIKQYCDWARYARPEAFKRVPSCWKY